MRNTREASEDWQIVIDLAGNHPEVLEETAVAEAVREAEKCLVKRRTHVSFSAETKRFDAPNQVSGDE